MKTTLQIIAASLMLILLYLGYTTYPKLDLITGFSTKSIASCHFIDNRCQELIERTDNNITLIGLAKNVINDKEHSVTASVYGLKERKAIFRPGLGAMLIDDNYDLSKPYLTPHRAKSTSTLPFPYGNSEPRDTVFPTINYTELNRAVAGAFNSKTHTNYNSRAVLVIYKDKIIAEKYESGFNKNSLILGWSMTKSVTSTLYGILQKQGKLDIYKPAPVPEWKHDRRSKITISDLLHMNSGLQWDENYSEISDATTMLFLDKDMSRRQLVKPAEFEPNTRWKYSSGTTNLLSGILRKQFPTYQQYLDFWYSALIDKIGMSSMLIETDMAGNYVGSSYGWATARDWSKFGLLYLHKGNWNGEQILDKDWVRYSATPTNTSNGAYGAHFWLNAGKFYKDAPQDMFYCSGFQGQKIFIIPSYDMVIVRMGLNEKEDFNVNDFIKNIISSVKK